MKLSLIRCQQVALHSARVLQATFAIFGSNLAKYIRHSIDFQ